MNTPVQSNVLLRNQRRQDYISGKALISPGAPACRQLVPWGSHVARYPPSAQAVQQHRQPERGDSGRANLWKWPSRPSLHVPMSPELRQWVWCAGRQGQTALSDAHVMSPTQQLATCIYHVPMTSAERKEVLLHMVNQDPRPDIALDPASAITPSTSDVRGRTGVFM